MSAYRREFDETKYMSFLIKDEELFEKYNKTWEKVKNSLNNKKYLKAKIKSYKGKINTVFYNNKIKNEGSQ